MNVTETIDHVGEAVEVVGVAIIVAGLVWSVAGFVSGIARKQDSDENYRATRQSIGRSILLGLEVLVAGDIIRTVAVDPTFTSVGVLAIIVLVRTFLSFTLEVELSGRWPWQSKQ